MTKDVTTVYSVLHENRAEWLNWTSSKILMIVEQKNWWNYSSSPLPYQTIHNHDISVYDYTIH